MGYSLSHIRKTAVGLLEQCGISEMPIDVKRIARTLGIEVEEAPYEGEVSGFLYQDGTKSIIGVNKNHHPNRQRFTIAHEFGHYMLHGRTETFVDKESSPLKFNRDGKSGAGVDPREVEANAFAAELLMPKAYLVNDLKEISAAEGTEAIITKLARRYKVSEQAMSFRLEKLGYIEKYA